MEADGIRVHGTKSSAAERVVPRVGLLVRPATKRQAFYKALRTASGETMSPYDCRRSYAQWLDLARIPQFRQSYHLGHGPKNLDQLYQRMRECGQYLREDAAALEQLVGEPVSVRLVKNELPGEKVPTEVPTARRTGRRKSLLALQDSNLD